MKEKKRKKGKRGSVKKMAVMTAECDRMFSVDKEQVDLFRSVQKNKKCRDKADIAVSKISKKIIIDEQSKSND